MVANLLHANIESFGHAVLFEKEREENTKKDP